MIRKKVQIVNKLGLHARAAAKLVQLASKFESAIQLTYNGYTANCKSIMGVMMLAASQFAWIDVQTNGLDEEGALHAIFDLIENRFGEDK